MKHKEKNLIELAEDAGMTMEEFESQLSDTFLLRSAQAMKKANLTRLHHSIDLEGQIYHVTLALESIHCETAKKGKAELRDLAQNSGYSFSEFVCEVEHNFGLWCLTKMQSQGKNPISFFLSFPTYDLAIDAKIIPNDCDTKH